MQRKMQRCQRKSSGIAFPKMLTSLFNGFADWSFLLTSPVWLAMTVFQLWMLVHAIRNREWIWAFFIFI